MLRFGQTSNYEMCRLVRFDSLSVCVLQAQAAHATTKIAKGTGLGEGLLRGREEELTAKTLFGPSGRLCRQIR